MNLLTYHPWMAMPYHSLPLTHKIPYRQKKCFPDWTMSCGTGNHHHVPDADLQRKLTSHHFLPEKAPAAISEDGRAGFAHREIGTVGSS